MKLLGFTRLSLRARRHRALARRLPRCARRAHRRQRRAHAVRSRARRRTGSRSPAGRAPEPLDGCVMTFAYWNPAILRAAASPQCADRQVRDRQVSRARRREARRPRRRPVARTRYRITGSEASRSTSGTPPRTNGSRSNRSSAGGRRLRYRLVVKDMAMTLTMDRARRCVALLAALSERAAAADRRPCRTSTSRASWATGT